MPRGLNTDAKLLRREMQEGIIPIGGEVDGFIDLSDDTPVYVALMYDVSGLGPHLGAIYAVQGRHPDYALQEANEILELYMREHYKDHLEELHQDALKEGLKGEDAWQQAEEYFRETNDGLVYEVSAMELYKAVAGTRAEKYIHDFEDRSGKLNMKLNIKRKAKKR